MGSVDYSQLNLVALHNVMSARYDADCLKCHRSGLLAPTKNAAIPNAHSKMIPQAPGYVDAGSVEASMRNADCVSSLCHVTVDYGPNRSAANLRRQVAPGGCRPCHLAPPHKFYQ